MHQIKEDTKMVHCVDKATNAPKFEMHDIVRSLVTFRKKREPASGVANSMARVSVPF